MKRSNPLTVKPRTPVTPTRRNFGVKLPSKPVGGGASALPNPMKRKKGY